jgi:predicted phage terminase large subunit-like protein
MAFVTATRPFYRANWHHKKLASLLDRFAAGEVKRLMIFAPPRSGKSELVSRCLPAFLLGRNPDTRIIAASYAADLARQMGRAVQRLIDEPAYRALFPATTLEGANARAISDGRHLRNADEFEIVGKRGGYKCSGVGGGITGRGFDFGIIDDPVKDASEAWSKVVRDSVWEWYTQVFLTRQEGDASILLTMTRWHADDLAGRLLASEEDRWEVLSFSALDDSYEGGALWPERFSREWLERQRDSIGGYSFGALYQQTPVVIGGNIWREGLLRDFAFDGARLIADGKAVSLSNLHRFNVADLAYSSRQSADYTVVGSFAGDAATGRLYLTDVFRARIDLLNSAEGAEHRYFIRQQREKARAQYTVVEATALATRVIDFMARDGEPVRGVTADRDKVARAHAALPLAEAGNVFVPKSAPWWPESASELAEFPRGAHDDFADVLAYGCIHWRDILTGGGADQWRRAVFESAGWE